MNLKQVKEELLQLHQKLVADKTEVLTYNDYEDMVTIQGLAEDITIEHNANSKDKEK